MSFFAIKDSQLITTFPEAMTTFLLIRPARKKILPLSLTKIPSLYLNRPLRGNNGSGKRTVIIPPVSITEESISFYWGFTPSHFFFFILYLLHPYFSSTGESFWEFLEYASLYRPS